MSQDQQNYRTENGGGGKVPAGQAQGNCQHPRTCVVEETYSMVSLPFVPHEFAERSKVRRQEQGVDKTGVCQLQKTMRSLVETGQAVADFVKHLVTAGETDDECDDCDAFQDKIVFVKKGEKERQRQQLQEKEQQQEQKNPEPSTVDVPMAMGRAFAPMSEPEMGRGRAFVPMSEPGPSERASVFLEKPTPPPAPVVSTTATTSTKHKNNKKCCCCCCRKCCKQLQVPIKISGLGPWPKVGVSVHNEDIASGKVKMTKMDNYGELTSSQFVAPPPPSNFKVAEASKQDLGSVTSKIGLEGTNQSDFVDGFFKKDGFAFIGILTQIKLKAEQQADLLIKSSPLTVTQMATKLRDKVDDMAEGQGASGHKAEKQLTEYNFVNVLTQDCHKLGIEVSNKLGRIEQFHNYAMKVIHNWDSLARQPEGARETLDTDTVTLITTDILATTVVLCFPIFIEVAKLIMAWCDQLKMSRSNDPGIPPEQMLHLLSKLVDSIRDEIGATVESSSRCLAKNPGISKDNLRVAVKTMMSQGEHAKNSVAWATRSIGTVLFLYAMIVFADQSENGGSREKYGEPSGRYFGSPQQGSDDGGDSGSGMNSPKKLVRIASSSSSDTTAQGSLQGEGEGQGSNRPRGDSFTKDDLIASASATNKLFAQYFFQKDGFQHIGTLEQLKTEFSELCNRELEIVNQNENLRNVASLVMQKIISIREIVKSNVGKSSANMGKQKGKSPLESTNFAAGIGYFCSIFGVELTSKIDLMGRYHTYVEKMMIHWRFRLRRPEQDLTSQSVYDTGTQMMAGTVALCYQVFIKVTNAVATFGRQWSPSSASSFPPPEKLLNALRSSIELMCVELNAIESSCVDILNEILERPPANSQSPEEDFMEFRAKLHAQLKQGKNAISWAMKAIAPTFFYYYIKVIQLDYSRGRLKF